MTSVATKNGKVVAKAWGARYGRIELTGDYEGWWAEMRLNPEVRIWEDFTSGDDARYNAALAALIREWNLTDDDGQPIPTPADGFDWTDAPFDLKLNLTNAYSKAVTERLSPPKDPSTGSAPSLPSGT